MIFPGWDLFFNMIKLTRWHPKIALRYLPIIQKIKKYKLENSSILEIGSGSLGITPYLGKSITGLDIDFQGPNEELLTKVYGTTVSIPFDRQSFDTVLMIDVLEHIDPEKRIQAIIEALRVTKKLLIIAFPSGELAFEEDRFLANYYQNIHSGPFTFFQEHLRFGLPTEKFVNDTIIKDNKRNKRKAGIEIQGNVNLALHRFLMKGWITENIFIDIIFRKLFLILIPVFRCFNQEPTYRKIFYIKFA